MLSFNIRKNARTHWQLVICKEEMRDYYKDFKPNDVEKLFNDWQENSILLKKYDLRKRGMKITAVRNGELTGIFFCVKNEDGTCNGQIYLSKTTDQDMLALAKCLAYNTQVMQKALLEKEIKEMD